jgi:hypothetical protein
MSELAVMPLTDYVNSCDKIREKTQTTDSIKSGEMPSKIDEVYKAGAKSEYDRFWDVMQANGTRTDYRRAFYGEGWREETFRPKYDLNVSNASSMFQSCNMLSYSNHLNLTEHLKALGIKLDTSKATAVDYLFYSSSISAVPAISTISAPELTGIFAYSTVVNIEKLILKSDGSQTFAVAFQGAYNIITLTIEGVIGQNGFDIHWSTKLSKESIISIINALSSTVSGKTITLSKTAVNTAFSMTDGNPSQEWSNLIATKSNWTISLA